MQTTTKKTIPTTILAKIVAETGADPKTVRRAFQRKPGKGETRRRVDAALRDAGLLCALLLAIGCSTDGSGFASGGTGGQPSSATLTAPARDSGAFAGTGGQTSQATTTALPGTGGQVAIVGTGGQVGTGGRIGTGGSTTVSDAGIAAPVCLPIEQTGCPVGQACYWGIKTGELQGSTAHLYCAAVGTGQAYDTCTTGSDCSAGTTCAMTQHCKISSCSPPYQCLPFCVVAQTTTACPGVDDWYSCQRPSGGTFETNAGICLI